MGKDKYIDVSDSIFFTEKQKGEFQIKMCDDHVKPFIDTLYNVLLTQDYCDRLFSIVLLMNTGHTCLFYKVF